jgi:hypothetical protein
MTFAPIFQSGVPGDLRLFLQIFQEHFDPDTWNLRSYRTGVSTMRITQVTCAVRPMCVEKLHSGASMHSRLPENGLLKDIHKMETNKYLNLILQLDYDE